MLKGQWEKKEFIYFVPMLVSMAVLVAFYARHRTVEDDRAWTSYLMESLSKDNKGEKGKR